MADVPSVSQNMLQQKYGQRQKPPPQDEFEMSAEKGTLSRQEEQKKQQEHRGKVAAKKARPSAILDLSPEAKQLLKKGKG